MKGKTLMDDFEKNGEFENGSVDGETVTPEEGANEATEVEEAASSFGTGTENEPSAAEGQNTNTTYGFSPDGSYRFAPQNDNRAQSMNGTPNAYPYNNNSAQNGNPYPYANSAYPFANAQQNNGYAPTGNPYPYANEKQHAYNNAAGDKDDKGKKNGGKIFGIIASCLCVVLLVALVFVITTGKGKTTNASGNEDETETVLNDNVEEVVTQGSNETPDSGAVAGELSAKAIYKKVLNTSVGILVYGKNDSLASEGSGVLFSQDKAGKYTYIITCAHVITDNNGIVVQLANEKEYTAEVVGFDTRTDIGVLRIEANGLSLAEIGDSSKLAVGDTVYAIGNPGGVEFANSFTSGMISALDRPVNSSSTGYSMECIQHTAAINPGNSGGALVNVFGQVIGINSMKIVDDEYEGMGFSVPSSVFTKIVNDIIRNGYVTNRPKLGITYVAASKYNSYGMFVAIKGLPTGSIVIYSMSEDSALAGTEAKEGDMIVAVNGKDLDSATMLSELIEKSNVGDEITLSIIRINKDYSYKEFDVKAKLVEDRGDKVITQQQEKTTQSYDSYEDYFRDFFNDDFFNDYFGGNFRR